MGGNGNDYTREREGMGAISVIRAQLCVYVIVFVMVYHVSRQQRRTQGLEAEDLQCFVHILLVMCTTHTHAVLTFITASVCVSTAIICYY